MKKNPRWLALEALLKIEEEEAYSQLVINHLLQQADEMDARDKSLVTEIVYGTLQHQRLIDFYLTPFLKQNIDKLDCWVKHVLRLSVYQLLFLDRIPERAVVHEAVEIAKKKGHRGIQSMVNGVLRNFIRTPRASLDTIEDPLNRIAVQTSHPTWMVKRWSKQFGLEETLKICEANNKRPPLTIRVNTLKSSREQLKLALEDEGYDVTISKHTPEGLHIRNGSRLINSHYYKEGYFTIQDESSMQVAPLVNPQPGMRVLDVCAAPGGKATHLAELMNNEGEIVANDVHAHKKELIEKQAHRLQVTNIKVMTSDGRLLGKHLTQPFDCILLDAPCTGLGVIRRKPDLKWKKKPQDHSAIATIQTDLLEAVTPLLKREGTIVYSTCTIDKEENDQVIEQFIAKHNNYRIVEGTKKLILPHHHDSDGFFMIKLQRME